MKKLSLLLLVPFLLGFIYHPGSTNYSSVTLTTRTNVLQLSGILQLPPRTVTNSTDSTWVQGAGLVCWDTNYLYISVGTNLWKRVELGSW